LNGCPYCSQPPKKLCDNYKCDHCYEKSFLSHEKAEFWSEKNTQTQREVFKSSNKKYIFNCGKCQYEFIMTPKHINCDNQWCPNCKNKTEQKFKQWLDTNNYKHVKESKFDWCKSINNYFLPFDFEVIEYKLIIEVDGHQHIKNVSNWSCYRKRQADDIYKMTKAIENGYSIIRVLQPDIYYDKNEWNTKITKLIKLYDTPTIIYINNENLYDEHINLIKKTKVQFTLLII
jgi:very-short-patch-repair endonuclease